MDALEAILGRRSIRSHRDEPVDDGVVEQLLKAAMAAPSAGNEQAWTFVVLRSAEARTAVAAASPYASMLPRAPLGIVVCGDLSAERHDGYWVQDCAAATENILLAAHALGLGAVWLGYHPRDGRSAGAASVLGLPDNVVVFSVVALGYPAEVKPPSDRYDPERVHVDRW